MSDTLLTNLRLQAEVQREILQALAWKSAPGKDRENLVLRAQCLDDFITVTRYAQTPATQLQKAIANV